MTSHYHVEWDLEGRADEFRGSLAECIRWAAGCQRMTGPNGPVHTLILYRADGSRVDGWAGEAERHGLVPLFRGSYVVDAIADSTDRD